MEVLIVLAILSIVIGIALPSYREHQKRIAIADTAKDLAVISQRLEKYYSLNSRYPDDLAAINSDNMVDPYGRAYFYRNLTGGGGNDEEGGGGLPTIRTDSSGTVLNTDYDLFSAGYDGEYTAKISSNTSKDDIVRGKNGKFINLAESY